MTPNVPPVMQEVDYEKSALDYLRSLPLEHFMEAKPQATQREITLESLALLRKRRDDVHVFNEMLVQYSRPGQEELGKVVPDNMVVLTREPIHAIGSYDVPKEPEPPFWVLEYVSPKNPRKDYDDSFDKYERELKVLYYLVFYPEKQKLTLYRHTGKKYVAVRRNAQGRFAIPELDLESGLCEKWVRYWYRGELLRLPAELEESLDASCKRVAEEKRRADEKDLLIEAEKRRADEKDLLIKAEKRRADDEKRRADDEKRRADELQRQLEALLQKGAKELPHPGPPPAEG